jgi:hypothetical protein
LLLTETGGDPKGAEIGGDPIYKTTSRPGFRRAILAPLRPLAVRIDADQLASALDASDWFMVRFHGRRFTRAPMQGQDHRRLFEGRSRNERLPQRVREQLLLPVACAPALE